MSDENKRVQGFSEGGEPRYNRGDMYPMNLEPQGVQLSGGCFHLPPGTAAPKVVPVSTPHENVWYDTTRDTPPRNEPLWSRVFDRIKQALGL